MKKYFWKVKILCTCSCPAPAATRRYRIPWLPQEPLMFQSAVCYLISCRPPDQLLVSRSAVFHKVTWFLHAQIFSLVLLMPFDEICICHVIRIFLLALLNVTWWWERNLHTVRHVINCLSHDQLYSTVLASFKSAVYYMLSFILSTGTCDQLFVTGSAVTHTLWYRHFSIYDQLRHMLSFQ
jgi:hypothetical protein